MSIKAPKGYKAVKSVNYHECIHCDLLNQDCRDVTCNDGQDNYVFKKIQKENNLNELTNEKTMTTRELSNFFGKSATTITRIANNNGMYIKKGKTKRYTKTDVYIIAKAIYKKVPSVIKNAIDTTYANDEVTSSNAQVDYEVIGKMIGMAITAALSPLVDKLNGIQQPVKEQLQLQAPKMDPRATITKNINDYVAKTGTSYRDAYTLLYRDFGYRTHCNPSLSAKNRNMKIIDYIDSEGQLDVLAAVSKELN